MYNRGLSTGELQTDMNTPVGAAADTTAPTVSISAPTAGATVSATTTVSAAASDNVGVAGVQFRIDGTALGTEDTTAPYSVSWNTTAVADGMHTLTAVARDAAGNTTTSLDVGVTVSNTAPPPPPSGLVAAYSFNEGTGTTVGDASGKGNVGTISNATWTTAGHAGGALSFNGTSSWVTVPDSSSLDLTNGMTLEAWVKPRRARHDLAHGDLQGRRQAASSTTSTRTRAAACPSPSSTPAASTTRSELHRCR